MPQTVNLNHFTSDAELPLALATIKDPGLPEADHGRCAAKRGTARVMISLSDGNPKLRTTGGSPPMRHGIKALRARVYSPSDSEMPSKSVITQIRLENIIACLNGAVTTVELVSKGLKTPHRSWNPL
jgi:hypothetical protein